jgi:hypothetical protein
MEQTHIFKLIWTNWQFARQVLAMFTCTMTRFYDREGYRKLSEKLEAEGQLASVCLAVNIRRSTMGSFEDY